MSILLYDTEDSMLDIVVVCSVVMAPLTGCVILSDDSALISLTALVVLWVETCHFSG